MLILQAILATVVMLFGHRLFWLFVAIVGFLFGAQLAGQFFEEQNQIVTFILAIIFGLLGAALAVFAQKIAIAVVGFFLLSGAVLQFFAPGAELSLQQTSPLVFILACLAGVIGAILAIVAFDWALIFLSSIYGALILSSILPVDESWKLVLWAVLSVIGIVFQAGLFNRPVRERPVEET